MMQEIFDLLREKGIFRVELCVSVDNEKGIPFYEGMGFVEEGCMKNYFARAGSEGYVDEILMACFLD